MSCVALTEDGTQQNHQINWITISWETGRPNKANCKERNVWITHEGIKLITAICKTDSTANETF